jgi:hypothetical protein
MEMGVRRAASTYRVCDDAGRSGHIGYKRLDAGIAGR